jgi:prephenate dehydrogenase
MPDVEVWGLGLMGLSLATALLQSGRGFRVYGVDRSSAVERFAARQGVTIGRAPVPGWVVLAVPPSAVASVVAEVAPGLPDGTVITDVTSVKGQVLPKLAALPRALCVVSSHPMAGRERGGAASFDPDLYRGRPWALIPVPGHPVPESAMRDLVEPVGARLITVPSSRHDRLAAVTSHLPYLSALALTAVAGRESDSADLVGPSFLGATRTAGSPPELWSEILSANRAEVLAALRAYRTELAEWEALLASESTDPLRERIGAVQALRALM